MKNFFLLFFTSALLLAGCSDEVKNGDNDMIWDFVNYSVAFRVADREGHDLLNSETEGNILNNNIVVTYNGKQYDRTPKLKYNMPQPLELRTSYYGKENFTCVLFGEFSPTKDYKGESFTIDWGDGTKSDIRFNLYITWNGNDPTVHKLIYLDGREYSDESFLITIVK